MGVTHSSKLSATFPSAAAPIPSPRRQLLPNDGKSLRSVATQQSQITVPNFVPFVPEIVPYPDVSSSYSIVLSRIRLRSRKPFYTNGFGAINRYRTILNRIGVFWPEHSLQAGGRWFETSTAHSGFDSHHRYGRTSEVVLTLLSGLGMKNGISPSRLAPVSALR